MADKAVKLTIHAGGPAEFAKAAGLGTEEEVAELVARVEASRVQRTESVDSAERGAKFWRSLGKKIGHGPAVRIPDGYDEKRR